MDEHEMVICNRAIPLSDCDDCPHSKPHEPYSYDGHACTEWDDCPSLGKWCRCETVSHKDEAAK